MTFAWTLSDACVRDMHGACVRLRCGPWERRLCPCPCHPPARLTLRQMGVNTQARPVGATLGWRREVQRDTGGRRYRWRGFGPAHQVVLRYFLPN